MTIETTINGMVHTLSIRSGDRLVDILRKDLKITSLLPDCRGGTCGRCLIIMDGRLCHSCLLPAFKAHGADISTYERVSESPVALAVEKGFIEDGQHPCQFCRTAKIMVLTDLLIKSPLPDREEILDHLELVTCPCTDLEALSSTVQKVAEHINRRKFNREK